MTFLILTETSAGYALFKAKDKKLLKKDDLASEMSTPEGAAGLYVVFCSGAENSLGELGGEETDMLTMNWGVKAEVEAIHKVRQRRDCVGGGDGDRREQGLAHAVESTQFRQR